MKMNSAAIFLLFLSTVAVGVVDSLKCYKCGFFVPTSVTRCQNLTGNHLETCPHKYCSKYVGLSAFVYGCEDDCHERTVGSFDSYCCSEDRCNGASTLASIFDWTTSTTRSSESKINTILRTAAASLSLCLIISRAQSLFYHMDNAA